MRICVLPVHPCLKQIWYTQASVKDTCQKIKIYYLLAPFIYKRQSYKTNAPSVLSHILVLSYRPKNTKQLSEVPPYKFSSVIFNVSTRCPKNLQRWFVKSPKHCDKKLISNYKALVCTQNMFIIAVANIMWAHGNFQ